MYEMTIAYLIVKTMLQLDIKLVIRQENLGKEIGVFLCGPPPIAADLKKCCKKYSDDMIAKKKEGLEGTCFVFHQENF